MDKKYKILFEDGVGGHEQGEIVKGSDVAKGQTDLTYLISIGAIDFVESPSVEEMAESVVEKLTPKPKAEKPAGAKE